MIDRFVALAIRSDQIFAPDFLETLTDPHDTLEDNVPWVEEVTSLLNARYIIGEDGALVVETILKAGLRGVSPMHRCRPNRCGQKIRVDHPFSWLASDNSQITTGDAEGYVVLHPDDHCCSLQRFYHFHLF